MGKVYVASLEAFIFAPSCSNSLAMNFRRATTADLPRLVEIHTSAFPDPRGYDARSTNLTHNAFGDLDDLRVVEMNGTLVAHAFLFPLEAWFGGARVRIGGVASVGVAPEARGSGVGSRLLEHLHDEARARGDAITILHAFRQAFYARHGYAPASPTRRLEISPHAIPREWQKTRARAMRGDDRAAIEALYDAAGARVTGWLARRPRAWDRRLLDERRRWLVVEQAGKLAGYVAWTVWQEQAHAETTMVVHELVAADDEARRALFGAIGAQRDQVEEVCLDVAADDPIDRALVDADRARHGTDDVEHTLGALVGGPMVRLLDVARALEARGYHGDGALSFDIDGNMFSLAVERGHGRAGRSGDGPKLTLSPEALAAITYGALLPSDAARLGWLRADSPATLALADSVLALPPYFALDPF